ncbi:MAG: NTP transferase domain-containing protein [Candidatus Krumholzibacteria bacterium]|nr:NTP transferase domain-containing protein [Candidatus Krumholzibacteria bacterium]
MRSSGESVPRRDRAVIMARGLSARMGVPKGLLRLSSNGPAFVRIIADLYLNAGLPVDVITREETFEVYRRELPECNELRLLPAEAGGDTALTLLIAWRSCLAAGIPCSHFWAHPVDLPLVTANAVDLLGDLSRREPDRIIRPTWKGIPGHPVILPVDTLAVLDVQENFHTGPLRDFLSTTGGPGMLPRQVMVEIEDPGIIRDFDRPDDFSRNGTAPHKKGAP